MTQQKRVQAQSSSRERQEKPVATPIDQERVKPVAEGAAAVGDAIDEILADFIPTEGPTEVIGDVSSVKKPSLRQVSAEEIVRTFRQEEGQ